MDKDARFSQPPRQASQSIPNFTLQSDSPAVDAGAIIPGITDDFVGKKPDIGAYERGAPIWKAGSTLNTTRKQKLNPSFSLPSD
ncbi:choice-of-anchor Q domain-containing protein [Nostoc sp. UHCC 0251]|uniref:choice-of-anchor Q domain-containing protein n=1 Tax=Nostoc sp. UHCC 0251 TaxID=3110240 RepID=UPI002B21249C|nr:choice-of-anchor Q domain-containing protein [Nostoc sp. UHCC 0251]MEA5624988.1 choice-of-anchor Q domain-containing protein [Nostoc sp. UHCC 0251]